MAKRKYEFQPDKPHSDFFSKLYLTQKQRLTLLRWSLFALLLVALSVVQDVILCRMDLFGATTDLVPCAIILICVILGAEKGSLFCLIAALLYHFSGTSPGYYVIPFITILGVTAAMIRQGYFRKSLSSDLLCSCTAVMLYEMLLFAAGLLFTNTIPSRAPVFALTGLLSLLSYPVVYPAVTAIYKIGGETWNE